MSDLQVIHDPALEMAAIVDLDTNQGWGPMCVGPNAADLLQAFVDGMPFDITILTPEQATNIFLSVFREQAAESIQAKTTPTNDPVVADNDPVATAAASGAAEPMEVSSTVPAKQPADADMAADAGQTDTVTTDPTQQVTPMDSQTAAPSISETSSSTANCLVCNANGQGSTNPACVVCGGTGKVAAPA